MNIIRAPRPASAYTIIRNDVLRDDRLSYRSRGVLAYLLSHADNWRTDVETLARHGREGKQALYTAMKEMEAAGYLERKRTRKLDGTFTWDVTLYDTPSGERVPGEEPSTPAAPAPVAQEARVSDPYLKRASAMVADVWEPAVRGTSPQPPVSVVRIVASALRNGVAGESVAKALITIANRKETVTVTRLNDVLNGKPARGQLAADTKHDWTAIKNADGSADL
jgi:hypothetical protein